jgi:cytochrome c553
MKSIAPVLSSFLLAVSIAAPAVAAETHAPAKPDLAKGEAISTNVCAACHVADNTRGAPANPLLKGQHPEYLAKQLRDFKEDKRKNPVMKGFAAALSEDDIRNVTAFYASKAPANGTAKSKATVALGEKIYRGGIPERAVPACSACHGPTGSGIPSQYPRLRGQHADYTTAQLLAFRGNTRQNSPQMVGVVSKMNDAEIKAVSDYIAGMR